MTMKTRTTPALMTQRDGRDALIRLVDRELARALKSPAGSPRLLDEAMRYCVFPGGKRFRPLACLGGCAAAGAPARQALRIAAAIELIHTYSLVHDDLPAMDNADTRRGLPSCHRKFGEATAILAGDALLTRAFELVGANGTLNTLPILRVLGRAGGTAGLIGGQVLDLQVTRHRSHVTSQELENIAWRKTAALITASVVTGGLAGGASRAVLARLERYGRFLGLAFQLYDDVHDDDGLAAVSQPAAVRRRADALVAQALREVSAFGPRGWLLADVAQWLRGQS